MATSPELGWSAANLEGRDNAGIIYPIPYSEWVSPVQVVPKKGGMTVVANSQNELIPQRTITGWRMCIDYRKLNKATKKDHFPLPFGDEMLEQLANLYFFCFLDGSWRYMMSIFSDMIEDIMELFMDDFSVYGKTFGHCLQNLDKVLQRCQEKDLGIRSFLGHAGFYRRFIKDFSTIARPLTNLLAKDAPFEFDDVCLKSFEILKKALVSAPIIQPPDWTLPFEIMCDARDFAVGAVLGQTKNKKHHAICYASKTLTGAQFNYSTTEKELLTIVFAIDKFRSYLVGAKVIVYTDHATLIYLFTKKDAKCHVLINSSRIKNHSLKGIIELIKIRKEIGKH
uniref:OSJNBa0085C10.32 protein n=1 Tax=Oryza sativa subsp. japonica TaxID=39947 RepID=Q5JPV9_ORYSJ|nr:OSJNBa0085C10.32 [Oryza sativa Japonica Group]